MKEYIKESNKKTLQEWKEWNIFKRIPLNVVNKFPPHIQIPNIISYIEKKLNRKHLSSLEGIYVGNFDILKDRKIQAMYNDGAIYVSNFEQDEQISELRIAKDIIHEVGHSLESRFGLDIYGDKFLEQEFLGKRQRLYDLMNNGNLSISRKDFLYSSEYDAEIDNFLFNEIGYLNLFPLTMGLFLSPYCVTSLSEYFGNGFEEFKTGDLNYLKSVSPVLFSKIKMLEKIIKES